MCPAVPTTTDGISASHLPERALLSSGTLLPLACLEVLLLLRTGLAPSWSTPLLRFAHGLEYLDNAEIDLPSLHVHLDYLDPYSIAKPVHLAGVLATERVGALFEPIVVVRHRRDVHQTFDEML